MAAEKTFGTLITIIIIVLVLVIAIFGIIKLNSSGILKDLLPDFTKDKGQVRWSGEEKLLYPGEMGYFIGDEKNEIYFWYNNLTSGNPFNPIIETFIEEGDSPHWRWSLDKEDWARAGDQNYVNRKISDSRSKLFLSDLAKFDNSPEKGLKLIIERVSKNNGKSFLGFKYDVDLDVKIGRITLPYEAGDKRLEDLDRLIIKFNQISRGVVKAREGEIK